MKEAVTKVIDMLTQECVLSIKVHIRKSLETYCVLLVYIHIYIYIYIYIYI